MQDQIITRIQQARTHARAGSMDKAISLLEQARAMASGDQDVLIVILRELVDAYQMVGRNEQASLLAEELASLAPDAATSAVELEPLNPPRGRSGALVPTVITLGCLLIAAIGTTIWLASGRHYEPIHQGSQITEESPVDEGLTAVSGWSSAAAPTAGTPAPSSAVHAGGTTASRDALLRANVGLLIKVSKYQGTVDGRQLQLEAPLSGGACFAVGRDGIMVTSKSITSIDLGDLSVDGSQWNMPTLTRRGLTTIVCLGPDHSKHYEAQVIYESPRYDLAIIKIDKTFNHPLTLAGVRPRSGQQVYLAGFPDLDASLLQEDIVLQVKISGSSGAHQITLPYTGWLSADAYEHIFRQGIVKVSDRRLDGASYLQINTAIEEGVVGGPLLTEKNQVAGICSAPVVGHESQSLILTIPQIRAEIEKYAMGS